MIFIKRNVVWIRKKPSLHVLGFAKKSESHIARDVGCFSQSGLLCKACSNQPNSKCNGSGIVSGCLDMIIIKDVNPFGMHVWSKIVLEEVNDSACCIILPISGSKAPENV